MAIAQITYGEALMELEAAGGSVFRSHPTSYQDKAKRLIRAAVSLTSSANLQKGSESNVSTVSYDADLGGWGVSGTVLRVSGSATSSFNTQAIPFMMPNRYHQQYKEPDVAPAIPAFYYTKFATDGTPIVKLLPTNCSYTGQLEIVCEPYDMSAYDDDSDILPIAGISIELFVGFLRALVCFELGDKEGYEKQMILVNLFSERQSAILRAGPSKNVRSAR